MPLSTAAKAALCLCPPAVMAGAVATVPAAKSAVHHMTAPHHAPKHVRHAASARPKAQVAKQAGCDPVAAAALPAAPIVTYAAPIPPEPAASNAIANPAPAGPTVAALSDGPPIVAASPIVAPVAPPAAAVPPVAGTTPVTGAVPEPATWLMVITGIGAVGAGLRRRRGRARAAALGLKAAGGATMWGATAAAEAGDVAATVAVKSAVASVAGKAMLCVCPAAVVAGSVMSVPPLRQAVHAATIADAPKPAIAGNVRAAIPCDGPMMVPVSATAIKGFPDSVSTVASPAAATPTSVAMTVPAVPSTVPAQSD